MNCQIATCESTIDMLRVDQTRGQEDFFSIFSTSTDRNLELSSGKLNESIAFEFSTIPEVSFVFTRLRTRVFYVWIITESFESEVRHGIYERQKAIIDAFDGFEFDFYVISREGQDPQELVSGDIDLAFERLGER